MNEEAILPVISQVSRIVVFGSLVLFVIVFSWMAGTLLLPWIKTGSPPPTFTGTTVCVLVLRLFAFLEPVCISQSEVHLLQFCPDILAGLPMSGVVRLERIYLTPHPDIEFFVLLVVFKK